MPATFTWSIPSTGLMTETRNGNADTVTQVRVHVSATDGTHTVDTNQNVLLPVGAEENFIPFSNLTEAQVVEWAKAALPVGQVDRIEAMLTRMLELQANPPVRPVAKAAPWNTCSPA